MATAIIKKQWQVANNGGWAETFYFWDGAVGAPDDLSGATATLSLIRPGRPASEALAYSSADASPHVSVSGGAVAIDIPCAVTAAWPPGAYDMQLRVFSPSADYDRYNLIGPKRVNVFEAPGT
jgi:hypothetical protein